MSISEACRLCSRDDVPLTFEHIPPRSALNDRKVQRLNPSIDEDKGLTATRGRYEQRGSGSHILCAECNSLLGRAYVPAYSGFVKAVATALYSERDALADLQEVVDSEAWPKYTLEFRSSDGGEDEGIHPARIAKQALWMLLGVSPPEFPAERAQLINLIVDRDERSVPEGIRLGFCFYVADIARIHGVAGVADLNTGQHRVMVEVSHPPLSWVLVVDGASLPDGMVDVTDWLKLEYDSTLIDFRIEALLGFGNTLYPADFRTVGQIDAQAESAGD